MAEQAGSLEVPLTALNEPIRLPAFGSRLTIDL